MAPSSDVVGETAYLSGAGNPRKGDGIAPEVVAVPNILFAKPSADSRRR